MDTHGALNVVIENITNSGDPEKSELSSIMSMPMMTSPWPSFAIVSAYLYFCLRAGPKMMEKKEPYKLKYTLLLYNLAIVTLSSWLVVRAIQGTWRFFHKGHCISGNLPEEISNEFTFLAWVYYISKVIELLDTIFFVLRKKMNQVSFLHVYHHTNMAVATWFYVRYIRAGELQMIIQSNTFIHVIMYSYYFLAALGPPAQKYLSWKKYLTRLQIVQFFFIIGYYLSLVVNPTCKTPTWVSLCTIVNTSSFLVLFLFFYKNNYNKKSKIRND